MKRVIFIGNRSNCLEYFLDRKNDFLLVATFVLYDSPLHDKLQISNELSFSTFHDTRDSWKKIKRVLSSKDYDLFISNGCPFIIPITKLKEINPTAIFLNTHPTYLPYLKGRTPLNGILWFELGFLGATTHLIDDGIDTGNIVYREKLELTDDLDQGLIYFLSFEYEKIVFRKAMEKLIESDYQYSGYKPKETGSYFNRSSEVFKIDFAKDGAAEIIRKINSVGIKSQGNEFKLTNGRTYVGHNAERIRNKFLLNYYADAVAGTLCHNYSDKLLVKVSDGLLKIAVLESYIS